MTGFAQHVATALDPVLLARRVGIEPEPWQVRLLRSTAPRVLVCAARQVGKSSMIALLALHRALFWPGSLVPVVSSRQEASNEFLLKARAWARALDQPAEESVTTLRFSNGSRLLALPATPDTTRGYSAASMLILDEGAFIQDAVYSAVVPTLAADGRLLALSTPAGPLGWFWRSWQDETGTWERHRVRASESRQYTPERLADVRRLVGEWSYQTDYQAEFLDPAGAAFKAAHIDAAFSSELRPLFASRLAG